MLGEGGDFERPNSGSDVFPMHQNRVVGKLQRQAGSHRRQFLRLIPIDAGPFSREGDGSVHRPGVEKAEAKPPCQSAGSAAFSGAGGAVDGHYHGSIRQGIWPSWRKTKLLPCYGGGIARVQPVAPPGISKTLFSRQFGAPFGDQTARFRWVYIPLPPTRMASWGESVPRACRLRCAGKMAVEALTQRFDAAYVRGFPLKI
jgi:hypothetical protein